MMIRLVTEYGNGFGQFVPRGEIMDKDFMFGIAGVALTSFIAGVFFCMAMIRQHIFVP